MKLPGRSVELAGNCTIPAGVGWKSKGQCACVVQTYGETLEDTDLFITFAHRCRSWRATWAGLPETQLVIRMQAEGSSSSGVWHPLTLLRHSCHSSCRLPLQYRAALQHAVDVSCLQHSSTHFRVLLLY